jgi:hypothetical protein
LFAQSFGRALFRLWREGFHLTNKFWCGYAGLADAFKWLLVLGCGDISGHYAYDA